MPIPEKWKIDPNKTNQHIPEGKIRLQFCGATGFVTGSRTLIETNFSRIYVDCGLYQGESFIVEKNFIELETDPTTIDAVILTHAHIDHSGLLPLLVKKGFDGPIFCTMATYDLLHILLPDSAHLQEEEYKFLSKKKIEKHDVEGPLFNDEDVQNTLDKLVPLHFKEKHLFKDLEFEFIWAGHILGASNLKINIESIEDPLRKSKTKSQIFKSILFSGDIGPLDPILHRVRDTPPTAQFIISESTYGSKLYHRDNYEEKLIASIKTAIENRGMLLIPSFAVGRAQLIIYVLYKLTLEGRLPAIPIYLDSPMASKATSVYLAYPEEMQQDIINKGFFDYVRSFEMRSKQNVGELDKTGLNIIQSVEQSKQLNKMSGPGIIISASGMCNGGRIVHHLLNRLHDRRNVVLFIGFQAEGTLGRQIVEGAGRVKIFNQEVAVRAKIDSISAFSAHADQNGLISWLKQAVSNETEKLFINHGEDPSRETLAQNLKFIDPARIEIPRSHSIYYL